MWSLLNLLNAYYHSDYSLENNGSYRLLEDAAGNDDDVEARNAIIGAVVSNALLFGVLMGLAGTVDCDHLREQLTNKLALGTGIALQFIVMPLAGYLTVVSFESVISKPMGVSLLVLTSSPGGTLSNWWCSVFNGDIALSVSMTTVSSILAIGMLPLNLVFYTYLVYGTKNDNDEDGEVTDNIVSTLDFTSLLITVGVVVAGITAGFAASYKWGSKVHKINHMMGTLCGIILVVAGTLLASGVDGAENNAWNQDGFFYLAVAIPCLVGMFSANIVSRCCCWKKVPTGADDGSIKKVRALTPPEIVTISIECCYQNALIATSVGVTMFSEDKEQRAQAIAVPFYYSIVAAIVTVNYCLIAWKLGWTKAPPSEKIWNVILKTYENPDEVEADDKSHPSDNIDVIEDSENPSFPNKTADTINSADS